jgi:hypothetical protein
MFARALFGYLLQTALPPGLIALAAPSGEKMARWPLPRLMTYGDRHSRHALSTGRAHKMLPVKTASESFPLEGSPEPEQARGGRQGSRRRSFIPRTLR